MSYQRYLSNLFLPVFLSLLLLTAFRDFVPEAFSAAVLISSCFTAYLLYCNSRPSEITVFLFFIISAYMALSLLVNFELISSLTEILRPYLTLIVMFLCYWGIYKAGFYLSDRWEVLNKFTKFVVVFAAFALVIEFLINPTTILNYNTRLAGIFFTEPSHLALTVAAILIPTLIMSSRSLVLYSAVLALVLFSPSAVLMAMLTVAVGCWLIISSRIANLLFVGLISVCLFWIFSITPYFDAFQHRLESFGNVEAKNISTLVYLNGYSLAQRYFVDTNGLGVGLNLMGNLPGALHTEESKELLARVNYILNYNDGSFLASKLIAELGILGLVVLCGLIAFGVQILIFVRRQIKKYPNDRRRSILIFIAVVYNVCISSFFLRSAGYFEPNVLLAVLSAGMYSALRSTEQVIYLQNSALTRRG